MCLFFSFFLFLFFLVVAFRCLGSRDPYTREANSYSRGIITWYVYQSHGIHVSAVERNSHVAHAELIKTPLVMDRSRMASTMVRAVSEYRVTVHHGQAWLIGAPKQLMSASHPSRPAMRDSALKTSTRRTWVKEEWHNCVFSFFSFISTFTSPLPAHKLLEWKMALP